MTRNPGIFWRGVVSLEDSLPPSSGNLRVYGSFDGPPFAPHDDEDDASADAAAAEIESIHLRNYSDGGVNFKGNIMRMKEGNLLQVQRSAKKVWLFAKLQPGRARKKINAT